VKIFFLFKDFLQTIKGMLLLLEAVQYSGDNGSHVVIQGPRKNGDQSGEETKAALASLHALVLQLLV
jgi:hypothetical protein